MTDSENPFVLLARITVKEGMVDAYLEIAEEVYIFSIFKNALDLAPYLLEYIKFRLWIFYER